MSSLAEIKQAIEDGNRAYEQLKQDHDAKLKALENGNTSLAAELSEKVEKINADVGKFSALKKSLETAEELNRIRIEELEARLSSPGKSRVEQIGAEHTKAFVDWIRSRGQDMDAEKKCKDLWAKHLEAKSITVGTGADGGVVVPEEIDRMIGRLEQALSPVRRVMPPVRVGTSDYKKILNLRGATAGWVGESGSRSETSTPTFREVTPTNGELYAYPQVSEWALDDIFFNVESWLAEEVAEAFALNEATAVISGNGTTKPTGMLNTTPVVTADFASPLRAAAAYQFVACLSTSSPVVAEVLMDPLITLAYSLKAQYRPNSMWLMNSLTTGAVRKLKNTNGDYLWQPSTQVGTPDTLLGRPVEAFEAMQDIATNAFPIAFGDFRRGYLLTERVGMRITRDNVTSVGFVKFYVRRREGGIVFNNDAIKWLRTTIA